MFRAFIFVATTAAAIGAASPAGAQFAKPEDAVKYRQGALNVLGQHFVRIGAMTRGRTPYDARAAVENAEIVAALSRLPWSAFTPATEKISPGVKPELWTEQARFREQHEKMATESAKLLAAAKTQNLDNLKSAFASAAATCKSCHDAYRTN